MSFAHVKHILTTKGTLHGAERLFQVLLRFAQGRNRFERMIEQLEKDFKSPELRVTFCVTASLLRRHEDLILKLYDMGHEIAAHGYYHTRMDHYDRAGQQQVLARSYEAFQLAGIRVRGFRCPYLNYNDDTTLALIDSPYQWTSQQFVLSSNGFRSRANVDRLYSLYHTVSDRQIVSVPRFMGDLIDIPINAPDDEMLVERYRIRDAAEIEKIWLHLLDEAFGRGELLHLLFHPERFDYVSRALKRVRAKAGELSPGVWAPTLGELTHWWQARAGSQWRVEEDMGCRLVYIQRPPRSAVLVRDLESEEGAEAICPGYRELKGEAETVHGTCYRLPPGSRCTVGVSETTPKEALDVLKEEGFLVERSPSPEGHGFYVDRPAYQSTEERELLEEVDACCAPLVRIWRWPDRARMAFVVSSDVDSITLSDFLDRTRNFPSGV